MRTRHLAVPTPAQPAEQAAPQTPAADAPPDPVKYAVVAERDAKGRPTALALPGRLAGPRAGLYIRSATGAVIWAADILPGGALRVDKTRVDLLRQVKPGTTIVAATDPGGRVISLTALCEMDPAGTKAKPQLRAEPDTVTRSTAAGADRYAHNPDELLRSGVAGRIIGVR
jgi:hypothetical protein